MNSNKSVTNYYYYYYYYGVTLQNLSIDKICIEQSIAGPPMKSIKIFSLLLTLRNEHWPLLQFEDTAAAVLSDSVENDQKFHDLVPAGRSKAAVRSTGPSQGH